MNEKSETPIESLTTIESLVKAAYQKGFDEGYLNALWLYAYWKDGVQYVGCGIQTLKEAKEEYEKTI